METPELPTVQNKELDQKYKLAFCMWIGFCVVGFIWFISKVLRGRRQIRYNFTNIEEQLKKIQSKIEERQKEKALVGEITEEEAEVKEGTSKKED